MGRLKSKMPSINGVQRLFLKHVGPSDVIDGDGVSVCKREWLGNNADVDPNLAICDEMFAMLVLAYIELILPIFSIGGSFIFKKDAKHIWGSNLPGLGCITGGSIFLALYYRGSNWDVLDYDKMHMLFKAHVGIAIAMCIIGALLILQVTLSFIGVLMCGECCSGERAVGLFAYIFTMIGLAIVFAIPIGTMAIGWTYAFGDCSGPAQWSLVAGALRVCNL